MNMCIRMYYHVYQEGCSIHTCVHMYVYDDGEDKCMCVYMHVCVYVCVAYV